MSENEDACEYALWVADREHTCEMPADHAKYGLRHKTRIHCSPSGEGTVTFNVIVDWNEQGIPGLINTLEPVGLPELTTTPVEPKRPWWRFW